MKKIVNIEINDSVSENSFPLTDNKNRFYKQSVARYPHEPTRDRFAIVGTLEKGQGLVSLEDISAGAIVFRFYGEELDFQTLFTLQKEPGIYIEDPYVMGKVLHSCEPNMTCDMKNQIFIAARPIQSGEFLTMDYETTEDELFRSFECGCGTELCRGYISGRNKTQNKRSA